jgi:hypothetical protein
MEQQLQAGGVLDVIPREHVYPTVRAAVGAYATHGGGS